MATTRVQSRIDMRRARLACATLLLASAPALAGPKYIVDGREVDPHEASRILPYLADGFFSKHAAVIGSIDDAAPPLVVAPGEHVFRLTFEKTNNMLLPRFINVRRFAGHYEIRATTRSNHLYAPVFRRKGTRIDLTTMCLVEVAQAEGNKINLANLRALREAQHDGRHLACATSSIPPDALVLCQYADDLFDCGAASSSSPGGAGVEVARPVDEAGAPASQGDAPEQASPEAEPVDDATEDDAGDD
jgi:hypothetical protein